MENTLNIKRSWITKQGNDISLSIEYTYGWEYYEYDSISNRHYYLDDTKDLRPCMDGAKVRRRISKKIFDELLDSAKPYEEDTTWIKQEYKCEECKKLIKESEGITTKSGRWVCDNNNFCYLDEENEAIDKCIRNAHLVIEKFKGSSKPVLMVLTQSEYNQYELGDHIHIECGGWEKLDDDIYFTNENDVKKFEWIIGGMK